jgi:hypothetical protein
MRLQDPLHGVLVATGAGLSRRGVLLIGPSGSGKSALALALAGRGFRLVADDRVVLWRSGGRLWGRAPPAIEGLMEIRELGVVVTPFLPFAPADLLIEACAPGAPRARIPPPAAAEILGVRLPKLVLDLTAWDACDKVTAAVRTQAV